MPNFGTDSIMAMDITASPSTNMQSSPAPSSIKSLYSKILSSCHRSDRMSLGFTPENKESLSRISSPFIKRKNPFNPFNRNLRERLENPILSPNVFTTVISPSQDSNEFKWTIEDLSKINPAPIEEEFHFEEQVDEQAEKEMQKTIDRYFTKTHMPSPWDCKLPTSWNSFTEVFKKDQHVNPTVASSPYPLSVSKLEFVSESPCQDASTQTCLSLPPDLPENLNSLLKPYLSDTSLDDINVSMNNSLRRKLFFQKDDEPLSPVSLFNIKDVSPLINKLHPSTPVIKLRTDGSPLENLSPLDISPINHIDKKPVCNNSNSVVKMETLVQDYNEENLISLKENVDPRKGNLANQHYEECFKVFESPKLTTGIRRTRKRRRSVSQDVDMSISYSNFIAKHNSTEQLAPKLCVCNEESEMNVDTFSENLTVFQDTGYGSANAMSFEKFTNNESNMKLLALNSWTGKIKDNIIVASTPTKE